MHVCVCACTISSGWTIKYSSAPEAASARSQNGYKTAENAIKSILVWIGVDKTKCDISHIPNGMSEECARSRGRASFYCICDGWAGHRSCEFFMNFGKNPPSAACGMRNTNQLSFCMCNKRWRNTGASNSVDCQPGVEWRAPFLICCWNAFPDIQINGEIAGLSK